MVPFHVPAFAVSVCPWTGEPEIVGAEVFDGSAADAAGAAALLTPRRVSAMATPNDNRATPLRLLPRRVTFAPSFETVICGSSALS